MQLDTPRQMNTCKTSRQVWNREPCISKGCELLRCAGGTFALYSLLKRQAGLGVRGKAMASDRLLKQYSTGLAASPSTTLGWATRSMRRRPTRPAGAPAPVLRIKSMALKGEAKAAQRDLLHVWMWQLLLCHT